jgi:hypothetical protein
LLPIPRQYSKTHSIYIYWQHAYAPREYAFDFKYFQTDTNDPELRRRRANSYVRRRHWVPREDLARAIEASSRAGTDFSWGVMPHANKGKTAMRRTSSTGEQMLTDEEARQQVEAEVSKAGAAAMAALQCKTMEEKVRDGYKKGAIGLVPHVFKVKTYSTPTWCAVCNKLLVGLVRQGYSCKVCKMNVHKGCMVEANKQIACKDFTAPERQTVDTIGRVSSGSVDAAAVAASNSLRFAPAPVSAPTPASTADAVTGKDTAVDSSGQQQSVLSEAGGGEETQAQAIGLDSPVVSAGQDGQLGLTPSVSPAIEHEDNDGDGCRTVVPMEVQEHLAMEEISLDDSPAPKRTN